MTQEVRDGKRGFAYFAIRKLGNRPGESERLEFFLSACVEEQLTHQQSAEKLADHFSRISQSVEPLEVDKLYPALREVIEDGMSSARKPTLDLNHVYRKIIKIRKPHSSVPGHVPRDLIKENSYEFAKAATKIFNKILQTAQWPRQ